MKMWRLEAREVWVGLGWAGMGWIGLGRAGLVWGWLGWAGEDWGAALGYPFKAQGDQAT